MAAGALAGLLAYELGIIALTPADFGATIVIAAALGGVLSALGGELAVLGIGLFLLAVFFTITLTPAVVGPAHRWIRDDSLSAAPAQAVVVLSAGVTADATIGAEGADRLLEGIELVQRGAAPLLVTTRDLDVKHHLLLSSDDDQRRLVTLAGLGARWTIVDTVRTTRDEALRVRAALPSATPPRIVLVTSPLHTRRACAVFEAVGFIVTCRAARMRTFAAMNPVGAYDRLRLFQAYLYERLGMIKYRAKGWVR